MAAPVVGGAVVAAAPSPERPVVGGVPGPEVGGLVVAGGPRVVGPVVVVLLPLVEVVRPVGDVVVVASAPDGTDVGRATIAAGDLDKAFELRIATVEPVEIVPSKVPARARARPRP